MNVPARLMLIPVVCTREDGPTLVPNDLLRIQEPDTEQPVEDVARKDRCVPNVSDLETRDEFEGLRPVWARVAGNPRSRVPLAPIFHVAWLGSPAAVQTGAIPPFGVELNSVWWVRNHQQRLAFAQ